MQKAFTLIEMVIAISIMLIAVSTLIVFVKPTQYIDSVRLDMTTENMARIANALSRCLEDNTFASCTTGGGIVTAKSCSTDASVALDGTQYYYVGKYETTPAATSTSCTYPSVRIPFSSTVNYNNSGVINLCRLVSLGYLREMPVDPYFGWTSTDNNGPTSAAITKGKNADCSGGDYYTGYVIAIQNTLGRIPSATGRNYIDIFSRNRGLKYVLQTSELDSTQPTPVVKYTAF